MQRLHRSLILVLSFAVLCVSALALELPGTVVLDYDPTPENPRNSEGAYLELKSGRIIFYYSQFFGGSRDHSPARIAGIHSDDRGKTWSKPVTVLDDKSAANLMSVSLLRLASGRIAFFSCRKSDLDCHPYVRISDDEAVTWSEPVRVVPAPGYFVLNNDRVIQTTAGRLIVPVAFHRSKIERGGIEKAFDPRGIDLWYLSDDEGKTWREADTWYGMHARSNTGLQEPGVVELADGTLFSWARTDQRSQYGCTSKDGGQSWTAPMATSLVSPTSPASIKRIPGSGDLLVIYNDHSGRHPFTTADRRMPLVSAISKDDGKTWSPSKVLEDAPDGGFCYTAIHFVDDAVLLAYCAGTRKEGQLNRLRMRRIPLATLTAP
jgi:Neuraminidase (sialidase)